MERFELCGKEGKRGWRTRARLVFIYHVPVPVGGWWCSDMCPQHAEGSHGCAVSMPKREVSQATLADLSKAEQLWRISMTSQHRTGQSERQAGGLLDVTQV